MSAAVGLITSGMLVLALLAIWIRIRLESVHPGFAGDRLYVIKATPAVQPLEASDYIELDQVGTKVWPIHIRIYADVHIERDTVSDEFRYAPGCPLKSNDKEVKVARADAQRVIARARDGGFYRFSEVYRASGVVYDAGTSVLKLSVDGQVKRVQDHAGNPPPLFWELIDSIRKLSPMDELVDPWKFSAERKADCEEFQRKLEQKLGDH